MFDKLRGKLNVGSFKDWQDQGRGLAYFYQRFFFYVSTFKNELLKPLGFWNEAVLILTFLTIRFGYNTTLKETVLGYLLVLFIAGVIGKLIVAFGIVKIGMTITNNENPEITKIIKKLEGIEKKLESFEQTQNLERPKNKVDAKNQA